MNFKKIVNFLKVNVRLISVAILAVLVIFLVFYSFSKYQKEKNIKIGQEINLLESSLIVIERSKEPTLAMEEQLDGIKTKLSEIYKNNKNFENGLRAQYILAKIDYKNGEAEAAKEKFLSIFDDDKKHHLAPLALLHGVGIIEDEANYNEAITLLDKHVLYYGKHFTHGEALLALSRNYASIGEYAKAMSTLESILKNEDLFSYHERANDHIAMFTIKGFLN